MKNKFSKVVILAFLLCSCFALRGFAQTAVDSTKYFVGYWKSDGSTARMVIFKDNSDKFQIVEWDSADGEEMEIVKLSVDGNTIHVTAKMNSTNWVTENTFSLDGTDSLKCIIQHDEKESVIYYDRLK